MRILFLLPKFSLNREPLGIMYLSSALKASGHQTMAVLPESQAALEAAKRFQPDILAYSLLTYYHKPYIELNRWLKEQLDPAPLSFFGGPHPTFWPQLVHEDGIDGVCVGEGEAAFLELVEVLERGEQPTQIDNWWIKWDGEVYHNPLRVLERDLDLLLFPDRELIADLKDFKDARVRSFITTRGCPFKCSYCFNHAYHELYGKQGVLIRRRSVENVLAEIKEVLEKYPFESLAFHDDLFIASPSWLKEFAQRYPQEVGLPFSCHVRAELAKPKVVEYLAKAGCAVARMGIEMADPKKRKELLGRNMSNQQILDACANFKMHGIKVYAYNILGLPETTIDDDFETLTFNIECEVDMATASIFTPYPKTKLGEMVIESGLWDGSIDVNRKGYSGVCLLDLEHKNEVEFLQRVFFWNVKFPALLPVTKFLLKFSGTVLFRRLLPITTRIGETIAFQVRFRDWLYKRAN